MIIIGTGSRDHRSPKPIRKVFTALKQEFKEFHYKHGGQRGFDQYSDFVLRQLNHSDIQEYKADWDQYGKAAGPIRNHEMLDAALEQTTRENILVVAMPLETSIGTYEMIEYARQHNVAVRIYDKEGNIHA